MKISGLQKLTLLDFTGLPSAIIFLSGCNIACPFCHNASLARGEASELSTEEVLEFLSARKNILEGVVISGGEPLLQTDLAHLVKTIKNMGYAVKLDTNGLLPDRLDQLIINSPPDYIAMDVKNSPTKYAQTCGVNSEKNSVNLYQTALKSAHIIMNSGIDYEFRTTVVSGLHTPHDMHQIGKDYSAAKRYFLQAFVDSDAVMQRGQIPPSALEMDTLLDILKQYIPSASIR